VSGGLPKVESRKFVGDETRLELTSVKLSTTSHSQLASSEIPKSLCDPCPDGGYTVKERGHRNWDHTEREVDWRAARRSEMGSKGE
jgi:hypothetical protein